MMQNWKVCALLVVMALGNPGARNAAANESEKPTAEAKSADKKPPEHTEKNADQSSEGEKKAPTDAHGVELGKFSIRMRRAVPTQTNRVSFTLFATFQPDESKRLEELLEHRENKVRDQVIVATRLVPVEEYDDPELTKFRRRILLRLRRTMPELMIDNVYVSDFNLVVENN
jgi:hypothetical protein